MSGLTFTELRDASASRRDRWHGPDTVPWTGADWSNAMCGEAGEAANVVKKLRRHETGTASDHDPSVDDLRGMLGLELADVVAYLDLLATYYGLDLGECVAAKFNLVSRRHGFPERIGL
jgi:NTP pyrophosphatase (non-canonical NTP hydrolase)